MNNEVKYFIASVNFGINDVLQTHWERIRHQSVVMQNLVIHKTIVGKILHKNTLFLTFG